MARRRSCAGRWDCFSTALWLVLAVVFCISPSRGFAADPAAEVEARVAAGEFGPALGALGEVNDPAVRDKLLGQIAAAQAGAGGRSAAVDTASYIASDLERKSALNGLSASQTGRASGRGARGGAAMADFDSLIELITSTVKPDSWDDVGGPGAIDSFRGGVYVDSAGLLRKL